MDEPGLRPRPRKTASDQSEIRNYRAQQSKTPAMGKKDLPTLS
ncbi:hypothetical protein [Bacillus licheniformis]|nr:hypothetical protein [Bacillus licheniformis]